MANDTDNQRVDYQYTGDVSSLKSATEKAINLLGMYEKKANQLGSMAPDKGSAKMFQNVEKVLTGLKGKATQVRNEFERMQNAATQKTVNSRSTSKSRVQSNVGYSATSAGSSVGGTQSSINKVVLSCSKLTESFSTLNSMTKQTSRAIAQLGNACDRVSNVTNRTKTTRATTQGATVTPSEAATPVATAAITASAGAVSSSAILLSNSVRDASLKMLYLQKAPDRLDALISRMLTSLPAVVTKPIDLLTQALNNTSKDLPTALGKCFNELPAVLNKPVSAISSQSNSGVPAASGNGGGKTPISLNPVSSGADDFGSKFEGLLSKLSGIIDKVNMIIRIVKMLSDAANKLISIVVNGISSVVTAGARVTSMLASWLSTGAKALTGLASGMYKLATGTSFATQNASELDRVLSLLIKLGLVDSFAGAIQQSINFSENINLMTVALKENYPAGQQFIDNMQEIYGMDPTNLMKTVGYFYEMSDAIDAGSQASYNMATGLTRLTNDISSLFNMDIETVQENLAAGMQGMSRAVRKYGMDIRNVTLQQTAANLGITTQVANMTEADRQGLRYITMLQQASDSQSDFANTIESPANQLRILKEQFTQLGRAIGNFFIPILQMVLPVLNGVVMAIRVVLTTVAALLGIKVASYNTKAADSYTSEANAISGVGSAAKKTAKDMKKLIAPFDELNILQSESNSSGSSGSSGNDGIDGLMNPKIAAKINDLQTAFEGITMKANKVRDAILKAFNINDLGSAITSLKAKIIGFWNAGAYERLGDAVARFFNSGLTYGISTISWDNIGGYITTAMTTLAQLINGFVTGFNWENLGILITTAISNLWNTVYVFFTSLNWGALGVAFADYMTGVFTGFDWNVAINTIFAGLTGVIEAFNGFMASIDWTVSANDLATGLNSIIASAEVLVQNITWTDYARDIGQFVEGVITGTDWPGIIDTLFDCLDGVVSGVETFFATIDWSNVAATLANTVDRFFARLSELVATIDWEQLGKDLVSFIRKTLANMDTHKIGVAIHDLVTGLIDAACTFFESDDWTSIMNDLQSFLAGLNWGDILWRVARLKLDWWWAKVKAKLAFFGLRINDNGGVYNADPGSEPTGAAFATGGIVTGPTHALIGEGQYEEAVIPLGNSPQMRNMIAQLANAVSGTQSGASVQVFIGNEEFNDYICNVQRKNSLQTNGG